MRRVYLYDAGTATAAAIASFTLVKAATLIGVSWCGVIVLAADGGLDWQISTSPVSADAVNLNESTLSVFRVAADFATAVAVNPTFANFYDPVGVKLVAGQVLYMHRSTVIAAPGTASVRCLLTFTS